MSELLMLVASAAIALVTKLLVIFLGNLSLADQMWLTGVNHGAVVWLMSAMFMMALRVNREFPSGKTAQ